MAETVVDDLVIRVTADLEDLKRETAKIKALVTRDTAKMEDGFKDVGKSVDTVAKKSLPGLTKSTKTFGESVKPVIARVGRFVSGLAAAAAAFLSVKAVLDSMERIDSLGKTADKLGIATDKLQALRLAAELTGVSTATLDMALQRMVRRVAEAAQGTGEAVKAIAELGLVATDLAAMTPDKQMEALADAMSKVDNQADRVRLAMKLFDSEGVALVNTLSGGSEALQQVHKDLVDMGAALSRVDAEKVEQANDAMKMMKMRLDVIADTIAVDISVPLKAFTEELADLGKLINGGEDSLIDFGKTATTVFGALLDLIQGAKLLAMNFERSQIGLAALGTAITGNEDAMEALREEAEELEARYAPIAAIAASTKLDIRIAAIEMERQAKGTNAAADAQERLAAAGGGAVDPAKAQAGLDALRESMMTEKAVRIQAAHDRLQILEDANKADLLYMGEYEELKKVLVEEADAAYAARLDELKTIQTAAQEEETTRAASHFEGLLGIEQSHLKASNDLWRSGLQGRLQLAQQFFSSFTPLMDSESRKAFEIGKAGALAETAVNTSLGAIKAYQAMAGIPFVGPALGIAAAGAVVATGIQTANQIRNTQFSGGGTTPTSPGSAGGAGSVATTPSENRQTNIRLENIQDNQQYSGSSIRSLAVALNEEVGNNVTIGVG